MPYLVYKTDVHHSYASRDVIGLVTTNKLGCIKVCKQQAKKEGEKISSTELYNLAHIQQTQGYSGEGEFQYEFIEANKLL